MTNSFNEFSPQHEETQENSQQSIEQYYNEKLQEKTSYHTLKGHDPTVGQTSEEFAKLVKSTVPKENRSLEVIDPGILFPEFNETHPSIVGLQKVSEYFYTKLTQTPIVHWYTVLPNIFKECEDLLNEFNVPLINDRIEFLKTKLQSFYPEFLRALEQYSIEMQNPESYELATLHFFELLKEFGREATEKVPPKELEEFSISIEELCSTIPGITLREKNNQKMLHFDFSYIAKHCMCEAPVFKGAFHKGGIARILLKVVALSKMDVNDPMRPVVEETIKKEFPLNDYDLCLEDTGLANIDTIMEVTGEKDIAGYDWYKGGFDISLFLRDRDTSLNSAVLGYDNFYFSNIGIESAQQGISWPMKCDQGIFGDDAVRLTHTDLVSGRTIERSMKLLIEGKASYLQFNQGDLKMPMGIYLLGSAARWVSKDKENIGEKSSYFLNRLGILIKKTGQYERFKDELSKYTMENPEIAKFPDILRALDFAHNRYPFVTLHRSHDPEGVITWIVRKVLVRLVRDFRLHNKISIPLGIDHEASDTNVIKFDLHQGMPSPQEIQEAEKDISTHLPEFLNRIQIRKKIEDEKQAMPSLEDLYEKAKLSLTMAELHHLEENTQ